MRCPACSYENRDGARFCGECATPLGGVVRCATCGNTNPAEQKFCDGCGHALSAKASAGAVDPRSYTPPHLAEKILTSRSALEGERKQVTVLFADIKGSMDLAESVDAEEWHRIMDRFFAILSGGIHRFEGTINQYTGDGVMALFGAPIAHEDHAHRACYAALHLTDELARYAAELRRSRGLNFSVRMGLNSGEVVVGRIGDDLRMDYTAQGRTVGLAARMEQLAAPDKVYLTEATAQLVSGYFRLADLGGFNIKGAREPVRVFDLQGVGPMRTRLDVARARGFSRLVGRERENAELDATLTEVLEGKGRVLGFVAAAGVGKSRLAYEFAERCRARGIAVHEGHCVAHGKSVPFLPVLEFLRSYFGITERDADSEARKKIAGTLVLLDETLRGSLPVIFDFLGVGDPAEPAPRMDPDARSRQLFEVIRRVVHARSRRHPLVVIFEDLHWMDGGTAGYVQNVVDCLPDTRTLLLVNYRPEYRAPWLGRPYCREIALEPLGSREIRELLADLLGRDASLGGLAERIQERTAGNPFFIEEVVQSLVEAASLEGKRGAYRLVRPMADLAIPATVQSVLAARVDRLAERSKNLLQTAAVLGKEFAEPVLKRVAGLSDADLEASLRVLLDGEFLYKRALFPETVYAFKHPLTQEVAYHSQLSEHRARVHGAVATAVSELYPEKLEPLAALLAHHWERAGEPLQAAQWSFRAAQWAEKGNLSEALGHWQRARSLLDVAPKTPETMLSGALARSAMISLGTRLGDPENEADTLYAEGKQLAESVHDQRSLALLEGAYAAFLSSSGKTENALAHGLEARRLAKETGDPEVEVSLWVPLVYAHEVAGKLREAFAFVEQALAHPPDDLRLGTGILGFSPYIWLVYFRAMFLCDMGRLGEAERQLDRAADLARTHGDLEVLGLTYGSYSILAMSVGEAELARRHSASAVEIAEKIGSPLSRALAYHALGIAHLLSLEWNEAIAAFEKSLAIAGESRTVVWLEGYTYANLAEAHLGLGNFELAVEFAQNAVARTRANAVKAVEGHTQLVLARVLLRTGGLAAKSEVESALDAVRQAAEKTGEVTHLPFVLLERVELARLEGDAAGAERDLREAYRLFSEMGATGHAREVARALGLEGSVTRSAELSAPEEAS